MKKLTPDEASAAACACDLYADEFCLGDQAEADDSGAFGPREQEWLLAAAAKLATGGVPNFHPAGCDCEHEWCRTRRALGEARGALEEYVDLIEGRHPTARLVTPHGLTSAKPRAVLQTLSALRKAAAVTTANTRQCFSEFIGQRLLGVLFDATGSRSEGSQTALVFDDGRALVFNHEHGSYWIARADEVRHAITRRQQELERGNREIASVLALAGALDGDA